MEQACYSGILAKIEEGPDRLSLVMVPAGTPEDRWNHPELAPTERRPFRHGGPHQLTGRGIVWG